MEKDFREIPRLYGVDALRGLAVVFMIEQHIIYWLCADLNNSGIVTVFGAMGGLAAPIFITLAGFGAYLTGCRYPKSDRVLFLRGLTILGFAYLLNALTPNWFSMGAWYILHLIGLSILMSPFLKRLSSNTLIALIIAILLFTVFIQNGLNTPLRLYNQNMANPVGFGDIFRHAMAEGFFPLFPWGAFFVVGFLAGRWFSDMKSANIYYLSYVFFVTSVILAVVYICGFEFARSGDWMRIFTVVPTFYPSLTPISLFLISITLFLIVGTISIDSKIPFRSSSALVCLGRASLTFFIIHVAVIRESAVRFHFWRSFSVAETLTITVFVLGLFIFVAVLWQRNNYRFGSEWLLRKVSG